MPDPAPVDNTIYLAKPPAQIPDCYKEEIRLISEDFMGIYTTFGIPYMIMAKLAGQGYVEPMDLSMRWETEEECFVDAAKQDGFENGATGYEEHSSRLASLRLASAMTSAKGMRQKKVEQILTPQLMTTRPSCSMETERTC